MDLIGPKMMGVVGPAAGRLDPGRNYAPVRPQVMGLDSSRTTE